MAESTASPTDAFAPRVAARRTRSTVRLRAVSGRSSAAGSVRGGQE